MRKVAILVLALVMLALSGAAAGAQGTTGGSQNVGLVTMNAQNNSGESGSATLSEVNGKLQVSITLQNGTTEAQPAHIHKGTCANLDPTPAYPLNNVVNGKSDTTLDITLATVMNGDYAINVHKSATDVTTYVSCGDLTQMARAGGTNPGSTGSGSGSGSSSMPPTGNGDLPGIMAVLALVGVILVAGGVRLALKAR